MDPVALQGAVPEHVAWICRELARHGFEAFVVGGAVRDAMLGRRAHDWDVATNARPEAVQQIFRRTVPVGVQHGTVAVLVDDQQVEVTTYRGESAYSDGRRPDRVVFLDSIEADLGRRDFTVNAMALEPVAQRLIDPFGGVRDLAARTIRAVGDPAERFREDGLRTVRAIRFSTVLGFHIADHTLLAIPQAMATFRLVSAERIRDELIKILGAPQPSTGLMLLRETGLLAEIVNEPSCALLAPSTVADADDDPLDSAFRCCDATVSDAGVRLASLLRAAVAKHQRICGECNSACTRLLHRLRLPNRERDRVLHLLRTPAAPAAAATDGELRRLVRDIGREHLSEWLVIERARVTSALAAGQSPRTSNDLELRLATLLAENPALSVADLDVDGRTLMAELGISAGPAVGQVLRLLLDRVLEDPTQNRRENLLALARELLAGDGSGSST